MTRRTLPVEGKRQRLPAGLRTQFFLTYIVRPAAPALTDTAAENQHVDQTTIVHVQVIPVVQPRTDDNHRTTVRFISVIGKFTGDANNLAARNAGNLLGPGRGVSFHIVIAGCTVNVVQATFQTVVCQRQIINGGHQCGAAISQLQAFHRQLVQQHVFQFHFVEVFRAVATKVREAHLSDLILATQQTQLQLGFFASFAVALLKIPFALLAPAEANRTVRRNHFTIGIKGDSFPFRIVFLAQCIHQISSAQHTTRSVVTVALFQHHQHRHVGVAAHIVGEILAWVVEVEFTQHYVTHCQRHCRIGALFRCQPQIAQFGDFSVVWCDGNSFGPFVTHFSKEVSIRGTRLRHV